MGLPRPICAVVHALFVGDAFALLSELAARVVSTDTVAHASNAVSVAPLIARNLNTLPLPKES